MAEYKNVLRLSNDKASLEVAWREMVSEQVALETIFSYLDEDEVNVRFTGKTNRGRAYFSGAIMLPKEGPGLTMGLVLHEVAHIISYNDKMVRGHGPEFVKVLDGIIFSEKLYKETT